RRRYAGDPGAVEIIVADNASTDRTSDVARAHGARVVSEPRRVIAAVRNTGAAVATGDILVFVDADSVIHPDTFARVAQALSSDRVVGGATGVTMDRWSAGIAVTYALLEAWCWVSGWDTGVLFCRRETFDTVGGFPERLLFAEDLAFYGGLRRLGRARGQRFIRLAGVRTVTSTRKFDQFGDWGWPLANAKVLWYALLHSSRERAMVERHWYQVRR
ncbi:MAG TPA: glycosyltransferase, partial [Gemmatimonadales bacterium]|nr:glycosyltransferase [Gemmatimonadales bacterium]